MKGHSIHFKEVVWKIILKLSLLPLLTSVCLLISVPEINFIMVGFRHKASRAQIRWGNRDNLGIIFHISML